MTTLLQKMPRTQATVVQAPQAASISAQLTGTFTMYAIAFDMDTDALKKTYGEPYNNAYGEIRKLLAKHNFTPQQGSVYFGDPKKVDAVKCVLAIFELSRTFSWFAKSVKDIRMLRIEEQNDLMDAVQQAVLK